MEQRINKFGASINAVDSDGRTALHHAVVLGHLDIVKTLTSNSKCDYNKADNKGRTALDDAKRKGHSAVVELLENLALPIKIRGGPPQQVKQPVTGGTASGPAQVSSVTSTMAAINIVDGEKVLVNF